MFDQVDLIDDVHQVVRLNNAPEDPVGTDAQLPLRVASIAHEHRVGLVLHPRACD